MNDLSSTIAPDIAQKRFVLATDLDGTFLGGSADDRKALYDWIEAHRDSVGLVFVTGRDPEFIVDLTGRQGVPRPDYVVGDVGTTIAQVMTDGSVAPIPALEQDIAATWNDSGDAVREALEGAPGLTLQPTAFRYRVSYDMDPDTFDKHACEVVEDMGHDWLISANCYFDVLPKGFSKGPSLLKLIDHLGLDQQKVLAAGDTLNDLSMLECGVPAVAVGGSEEPLLSRVRSLDHVHKASAIGAAGITEAIRAFNLHPEV
ncbi:HAD-superfamily hydrolase, subfamily IIB [Cohaesibacter sp. ES.047]|uniref:HAD-IIB family hydrolase n=1 Tax=Cohaesibacter sp. ES.047 TaxID=1798205 RepID=UPI000BB6F60E|nr:HAD-IIB family hydrolase [Cohaesibacter sp. ES.047]SNY91326.1 HAD-superfamily hydrolase, subfamily IIB [Cohaesibacter sp. ES.047]